MITKFEIMLARALPQKDFTSIGKPEVRLRVENARRAAAGEGNIESLDQLCTRQFHSTGVTVPPACEQVGWACSSHPARVHPPHHLPRFRRRSRLCPVWVGWGGAWPVAGHRNTIICNGLPYLDRYGHTPQWEKSTSHVSAYLVQILCTYPM
eukprot:COSAG02_NODE_776_length_17302_cov_17.765855_9_plen_152_part_00